MLGVLCVGLPWGCWLAFASGCLGRFCVRLLGWLGGALGWLGAGFGVAVACVVIPCLRSYACWAGLGVLWCWLGAGLGSVGGITTIGAALRRVAGVSVVYGRKTPAWLLGCAVASPCGGLGLLWCLVVWCLVVCLWCRCGLGRLCWWLGGNCYHRRCFAACRRRVGGLWSRNPPWLLGRARAACSLGGCVGCVRHVFVCLSGWCGLFSLVAWGELLP